MLMNIWDSLVEMVLSTIKLTLRSRQSFTLPWRQKRPTEKLVCYSFLSTKKSHICKYLNYILKFLARGQIIIIQ